MDSYVLRIYRRTGRKSRILIGTIEAAGTGKKGCFSNIEELWANLRRQKRRGETGRLHLPDPTEDTTLLDVGTRKKGAWEGVGFDR